MQNQTLDAEAGQRDDKKYAPEIRSSLGPLPGLKRKGQNKGVPKYGSYYILALLPKVQKERSIDVVPLKMVSSKEPVV